MGVKETGECSCAPIDFVSNNWHKVIIRAYCYSVLESHELILAVIKVKFDLTTRRNAGKLTMSLQSLHQIILTKKCQYFQSLWIL